MITLKDFQSLAEGRQIEMLFMQGQNLEINRTSARHIVQLYSLHSFYVEIYFDPETEEPFHLKSFNCMRHLDLYLKSIDIADILASQKDDSLF